MCVCVCVCVCTWHVQTQSAAGHCDFLLWVTDPVDHPAPALQREGHIRGHGARTLLDAELWRHGQKPQSETHTHISTRLVLLTRLTLTKIVCDLVDVLEISHLTSDHVNEVLDQTEEFLDVCTHLQQSKTTLLLHTKTIIKSLQLIQILDEKLKRKRVLSWQATEITVI